VYDKYDIKRSNNGKKEINLKKKNNNNRKKYKKGNYERLFKMNYYYIHEIVIIFVKMHLK